MKIRGLICAGLLLSASAGAYAQNVPEDSPANERKAIVEFCKQFPANDPAGCIAGNSIENDVVALCFFFKQFGLLDLVGYRTQGECVADGAAKIPD